MLQYSLNPTSESFKIYENFQNKICFGNEIRCSNLYLLEENQINIKKVKTLKILGSGGSKKVIEISGNQALILPNMDVDPTYRVKDRWPRMIDEEVLISKLLHSINLLGVQLKRVKVFIESNSITGSQFFSLKISFSLNILPFQVELFAFFISIINIFFLAKFSNVSVL